jgi:predicted esterase
VPDTRQPGTQSVGPRPASPSALVLVRQLAGWTVLLAHGDQDRVTDPERSYAYALRARQVSDQVCRFDLAGEHP